MTQEEIQKAASDSVHDTIGFVINEFDINFEENNYEAGRRDALFDYGSVLFTDGAKWRINSVWHDVNEVIIKPGFILIEFQNKHELCYNIWRVKSTDIAAAWDKFMKENKAIRYAYIKDLLPINEDEK